MLRLTTFGALTLRADDRPVGAAAAQRRPLAVLACIAAGGGAGVTRDRILSLLWPDTDPERARRALTQTLYALRRDTACDALVRGTGHLRFDEAHVHVDTIAVEHLLREGRPADAAALYRGAFLEGFQLAGSEEFERWLELERRRWHRRVSELLQRLAREARARHAIDEELAWCRRLVDHDPVDGAATVALVEALGRAGDPSGARRVVRDHETAVRLELGMPVTQAVASALARVEAGVGTVASPTWRTSATIATLGVPTDVTPAAPGAVATTRRDAPDHDARRTSDAPGAALAAAAPLATPLVIDASPGPVPAPVPGGAPPVRAAASRARHPGGRTLRRIAGSALAIVVASLLVRVAAPGTLRTVRPVVAVGAVGGVAVTPFSMELADTTLAFLAHDATELMARRLADADDVAVIPMETVNATWRSLDAGAAAPATPRARAMETARRVGASEVVVGRVTGRATRLVITVSALDAVTGRERAGSTMRAPVDSLATIVDALVGHLVAARTLGRDRGEALARTPLDVLRPYLRAEAAYRADRFREAMTLYDASLDRDSTFAPAALGLALAADRLNSAEQHDRALAIAWTSRERLGARDRALLLALAGPRYPAPSPVAEQVAAWERAIELAPDRAEAWTALGERFFADGALLGIRDPHARAATAFGRALAHDTTDARARRRLVEIALRSGDTATARALVDDGQPMRTGALGAEYLGWRIALARGDRDALHTLRERMPAMRAESLRDIALAAQHDGVALHDGERAIRLLATRAALGAEQLDALLAEHSFALNGGQSRRALDVTERLHEALPGSRAHLRLRVLDALHGDGDTAAARVAARELATHADAPSQPDAGARAIQLADACVLAQWRAAPWSAARDARDEGAIRRAVRRLRAEGIAGVPVPVGASPRACADLVEAMLAVTRGDRDARARLDALDALMLTGPALGDASSWATLALARLYERLGATQRAVSTVRQRAYMNGWPRYRASSLRVEAHLATALGDTVAASAAWRAYLALRDVPAPARRQHGERDVTSVPVLDRPVRR